MHSGNINPPFDGFSPLRNQIGEHPESLLAVYSKYFWRFRLKSSAILLVRTVSHVNRFSSMAHSAAEIPERPSSCSGAPLRVSPKKAHQAFEPPAASALVDSAIDVCLPENSADPPQGNRLTERASTLHLVLYAGTSAQSRNTLSALTLRIVVLFFRLSPISSQSKVFIVRFHH